MSLDNFFVVRLLTYLADRGSELIRNLDMNISDVIIDFLFSIYLTGNSWWIRFGGRVLLIGAGVLGWGIFVDGSDLTHPRSASNYINFRLGIHGHNGRRSSVVNLSKSPSRSVILGGGNSCDLMSTSLLACHSRSEAHCCSKSSVLVHDEGRCLKAAQKEKGRSK